MAYRGRTILAVVPARGGSKGISRKNLINVNGKSLIAHAATICCGLTWVDRSIISTDDDGMRNEGLKYGLDAPFKRPFEHSQDGAKALSVWRHAVQTVEETWLQQERGVPAQPGRTRVTSPESRATIVLFAVWMRNLPWSSSPEAVPTTDCGASALTVCPTRASARCQRLRVRVSPLLTQSS